jgi:bifunctional DNA-binding transcriptional regulator/antitoxin component of YhaV-PrlF toxin-antitoxin module
MEVVGKSTITGKYQLTLPKFVREFLRADNGDLIVFIKDHDKILVKRGTVKIEEWIAQARMHGGLQDPLIELQQPQLGKEFNDALVESIDETITSLLSRTVVDALFAHLQTIYSISRDEVPYRLDTLLTALEKIFGVPSSQTITKAIAKKFYLKMGLEFTGNPSRTLLEYVDGAKMKLQNSSSK